MTILRQYARFALEKTESVFDAVFTPAWNPLYQLGALGWFFYWIVVVSGVYLYIFFDSGVTDAYASVERITHGQWYAGGVLRSFHRYASDALIVVVMVHLIREYVLDRLRGPRWFAWVSGVAMLWLIFVAGISGYWIVWDMLAQYVAVATTEWLDTLPLFGEPIARNFLHDGALSGRFFTLMIFIHIAVPLVLLLFMWVHIQRQSQARVMPSRGLAIGTVVSMLGLSLLQPVHSQGMPDLDIVPGAVSLDWFYLGVLPLSEQIGRGALWVVVVFSTLVLSALPWLPPAAKPKPAIVNLDNCNGCGRCHDDCPFGAVTMERRTDGAPYAAEAVVDTSQCVSCGICTGACPTSTPFRTRSELVAGIEQPELTTLELRDVCLRAAERLSGPARTLVFACPHGVPVSAVFDEQTGVVELPCVGMLPPSFVDFLISRRHVDAVMLTGCREGDCHFRHGIAYTRARIQSSRDPYLRKRVPRDRVACSFPGLDGAKDLEDALARLRERVELAATGDTGEAEAHSLGVMPKGSSLQEENTRA